MRRQRCCRPIVQTLDVSCININHRLLSPAASSTVGAHMLCSSGRGHRAQPATYLVAVAVWVWLAAGPGAGPMGAATALRLNGYFCGQCEDYPDAEELWRSVHPRYDTIIVGFVGYVT
jgi:hypothetical protein